MVRISICLMVNDSGTLLVCLLATSVSSLERPIQVLCPLSKLSQFLLLEFLMYSEFNLTNKIFKNIAFDTYFLLKF